MGRKIIILRFNQIKKSDNRPKTNIKLFKHEALESPLRSHGIILANHFSLCIYSSKNILTAMLSFYIFFCFKLFCICLRIPFGVERKNNKTDFKAL